MNMSLQNYTPPNAQASEYQSIPLNKIEDFGVHASRYYPLDVSFFKSSLDTQLLELLWNKYWVMTLSQSPLISVSKSYKVKDMINSLTSCSTTCRTEHTQPLRSAT